MAGRFFAFFVCTFSVFSGLLAQERALHLPQVSILATPGNYFANQSLDSTGAKTGTNTLTELLVSQPEVYVKNYGPGSIATLSVRGLAASHTTLVWKGLPINNAMLGMFDASLLSGPVLEGAILKPGGQPEPGLPDNFGGLLQLGKRKPWDRNRLQMGLQAGSFGNHQEWLKGVQRLGPVEVSLAAYRQGGENDFVYRFENQYRRQTHARVDVEGVEGSVLANLARNWSVESAIWWQHSDRQIGPSVLQASSDATQKDKSLRISQSARYANDSTQAEVGYGFVYDNIDYANPTIALRSESEVGTHHLWISTNKQRKAWQVQTSGRASHAAADTRNYIGGSWQNRASAALQVAHSFRPVALRLSAQCLVEAYQFSKAGGPKLVPLPQIAAQYNHRYLGGFQLAIGRKMRLPTLNDLFWQNGGNPNLKPETGYTADISWNKKWTISPSIVLATRYAAYSSIITNYIQWVPNGLIWRPENLAEVQVVGGTFGHELAWLPGTLQIKLSANYNLVQSVQTRSRFANDASVGQQLIYVPVHHATGRLTLRYKVCEATFWNEAVGMRYTNGDNTSHLPAYHLFNGRLSISLPIQNRWEVRCFAEGVNLTGTSFQMVQGYPMPLQQFKTGLQINFFNSSIK